MVPHESHAFTPHHEHAHAFSSMFFPALVFLAALGALHWQDFLNVLVKTKAFLWAHICSMTGGKKGIACTSQ